MSKSKRKSKVLKSGLIPKKYKDQFSNDFDDLIMNIEVVQEEEVKATRNDLRGFCF